MSDFWYAHFDPMYFFFFLPFFCIIYGEQSKSVIFFGPIKILGKKGKKRVLYSFWSKILKIAKFHFFPKIVLFCTLFTLFVLFVHKCDLFTNSGYFMLKRIPECTIPFFYGNFGEILTFFSKMSDFWYAHFNPMDLFSFLPFFSTIYTE